MRRLLSGEVEPLTWVIGFLELNLEAVADAMYDWTKGVFKNVTYSRCHGSLQVLLKELEPLTIPASRRLLVETRSAWTAYFDNSLPAPDAFGPVSYMAQQLRCRGLIATHIPFNQSPGLVRSEQEYSVKFELFGPEDREWLNYERWVEVAYADGRWHFDCGGNIQPYEDAGQYRKRRIADRFGPENVEKYLQALGIQLMRPEFYGPAGNLLAWSGGLPTHARRASLADARRELGLDAQAAG